MSDKLKIVQTQKSSIDESGDSICASIGYPELRMHTNATPLANKQSNEQPILEDNLFDGYVSKAEFEDLLSRRGDAA